jgi:hypothetical protein
MTDLTRTARRWVGVVVVLLSAGCNDPPTSPSDSIILPDGDYVFTISLGTLPPIGGSPTFCMASPGAPLSSSAPLPVRVTRADGTWTIRMPEASGPGGGSLQVTFTAATDRNTIGALPAVSGTVEGLGQSADGAISVTIPAATALSGTQPSANTMRGQINGDVRLENAQGTLSCRSPVWALGPR